jgi:DNA-binding transcriptional MerR regulator
MTKAGIAARTMGPAEVARRLGISVKALKTYERVGLLLPDRTRRGWRTYSEADVERLSRALGYKAMGFSLSQISGLLDASPEEFALALAAQELYMLRRRAEVDAVLAELRRARSRRSPSLRLVA